PRRHSRIIRPDIPAPEIDPALKAFGRHIARCYRRGRGVHIPSSACSHGLLGRAVCRGSSFSAVGRGDVFCSCSL
ncbi:hypothetical protein F7377_22690, partial [Salmonella enterica]|nr:hypothetical protein [Salmonella enterica]